MSEYTINKEVVVTVPEDFHVLTEQEFKAWIGKAQNKTFAMRKESAHVAIVISWKDLNFLMAHTTPEKSMEQTKVLAQKRIPSYREQGDVQVEIGGKEAMGFRYSYEANGIGQTTEYIVIRHNKRVYSFMCMSQGDMFEENYPAFEELLKNVRFC